MKDYKSMIGKYEEAIVNTKLELLYHIPVCQELKWCILPIDIFNISMHCLRVGFSTCILLRKTSITSGTFSTLLIKPEEESNEYLS